MAIVNDSFLKQLTLQVLLAVSCVVSLLGQPSSFEKQNPLYQSELNRYEQIFFPQGAASEASAWFDVTYYRLRLSISTSPQYLIGVVTIEGIVQQEGHNVLVLDLNSTIRVDSVKRNGVRLDHQQGPFSFTIGLGGNALQGEKLVLEIYYQGRPENSGGGFASFVFGTHGVPPVPWIWTLSEPYGAKDWWPCKDHPSDKADSADVIVTCDSALKVGSNGRLVSRMNNGDGTATTHWQERYPIASYLISLAITDYAEFTDAWEYAPDSTMPILNYVLTENVSQAQSSLSRTASMLSVFSELFGRYPFYAEKYGHAEFGSGGAMEHQTMTSIRAFNEPTVAHELAHQWFGDMITCRTWSDLWLNEGFATYSEALWAERSQSFDAYRTVMAGNIATAKNALGPLHTTDTTDIRRLFSPSSVYAKGASVLHMLRHVVGDSLFFRSLINYSNDPALKYRTASTQDFQRVVEATTGFDLSYFFQQWIYGERYPVYRYSWSSKRIGTQYYLSLEIHQSTGTANPTFFIMPVDVRIIGDGMDTMVIVLDTMQRQTFEFVFDKNVANVFLDPDNWILADKISLNASGIPADFTLGQNYPNPFNASTHINVTMAAAGHVSVRIVDGVGKWTETLLDDFLIPGIYPLVWQPDAHASGVYYAEMIVRRSDYSILYRSTKRLLFLR